MVASGERLVTHKASKKEAKRNPQEKRVIIKTKYNENKNLALFRPCGKTLNVLESCAIL